MESSQWGCDVRFNITKTENWQEITVPTTTGNPSFVASFKTPSSVTRSDQILSDDVVVTTFVTVVMYVMLHYYAFKLMLNLCLFYFPNYTVMIFSKTTVMGNL